MVQSARILVVDDESSMREMLSILLKRQGYEVAVAASGRQVKGLLDKGEVFDLVVTDLLMDHGGGIDVLTEVKERDPGCEVILITAYGTAESAVEAMKKGAYDYIAKPFNVDEFHITISQALERRRLIRENIDLRARIRGEFRFSDIIGKSAVMKEVIDLCRKVAESSATVLISGESGTGKEVMARAIHFGSRRADKPFIAINCGALPEHLMESELFGHVKGAFTGASEEKEGLFRAANSGTILLDEIGELPLPLQVKMLRVLQDHAVRPVGGSKETSVDVRVLAATNRDLGEQVSRGLFRQDLFFRLNVINIGIPPLRDRKDDIPLLVEDILRRLSAESGDGPLSVSRDAMFELLSYDYPGNVRELANVLERAATFCSSNTIDKNDLPPEFLSAAKTLSKTAGPILPESGLNLDETLSSVERSLMEQALNATGGVRTKAASLLGISFRSLRYRLQKFGMDQETTEE